MRWAVVAVVIALALAYIGSAVNAQSSNPVKQDGDDGAPFGVEVWRPEPGSIRTFPSSSGSLDGLVLTGQQLLVSQHFNHQLGWDAGSSWQSTGRWRWWWCGFIVATPCSSANTAAVLWSASASGMSCTPLARNAEARPEGFAAHVLLRNLVPGTFCLLSTLARVVEPGVKGVEDCRRRQLWVQGVVGTVLNGTVGKEGEEGGREGEGEPEGEGEGPWALEPVVIVGTGSREDDELFQQLGATISASHGANANSVHGSSQCSMLTLSPRPGWPGPAPFRASQAQADSRAESDGHHASDAACTALPPMVIAPSNVSVHVDVSPTGQPLTAVVTLDYALTRRLPLNRSTSASRGPSLPVPVPVGATVGEGTDTAPTDTGHSDSESCVASDVGSEGPRPWQLCLFLYAEGGGLVSEGALFGPHVTLAKCK